MSNKLYITHDELIEMGFVRTGEESNQYESYEKNTQNFSLVIECDRRVLLFRRNPDTDGIELVCKNKHELENILAFIAD